jgi:hypothetical protein
MKLMPRTLLALSLSLGVVAPPAPSLFAADPPPGGAKPAVKKGEETYLTAAEAPALDFKLQGEYGAAEAGKAPFGADVIALSDNTFRIVLFPGGLPGAGWDGDKSKKEEFEGKAGADGKFTVVAKGWTSITVDGQTATLKRGHDKI